MKTETVFVCNNIEPFGCFKLPPSYSFAVYQPGDWKIWEKMRSGYDAGTCVTVQPKYFNTNIRKSSFCDVSDVFFLYFNAVPLATVSLQFVPSYREKGIRLSNVYSFTDSPKRTYTILIKSVLKEVQERGYSAAWTQIEDEKVRPAFIECGFKPEKIRVEKYHKDHTDYSVRVKTLFRWHENRVVGESTGNTTSYRGDEHLYHPSRLGSARIKPQEVMAGEDKSFELCYTAGAVPIEKGDSVLFWMPGQGSLGTAPQCWEVDFPGYIELSGPAGIELEPVCDKVRVLSMEKGENPKGGLRSGEIVVGPVSIGFKIIDGKLNKGQEIKIAVGRRGGFVWKKLCGRKEFTVIIRSGKDEPDRRLPAPVKVEIKPLSADHLEIFLPGTIDSGEKVEAQVSVRDRYDNRVKINGFVSLHPLQADDGQAEDIKVYLSEGRGTVVCGRITESPFQVSAHCNFLQGEFRSNICVPVSHNGLHVFFGDMHTHDFLSTAESYPADCYLWGRDEKRLDFQSLPVQVHRWIDNEKWAIAKHMTEYYLDEGKFVTFLSFEYQHSMYGDKVVHYLGNDSPYLPVDDHRYDTPEKLYQALRKTDAFIISHHPGYELDLHVPGTDWDIMENDIDRLVEIWSIHGSSEGFGINRKPLIPPRREGGAMDGLKKGKQFGIVAGSDTHNGRPGGSVQEVRPYGGGLCAVWAEDLTRKSLYEAFKARRTYALTKERVVLLFTVNDSIMGSEIVLDDEYKISLDAWSPINIEKIQILLNSKILYEETIKDLFCHMKKTFASDNFKQNDFIHARVVLENGEPVVCSPVWIN
jgi:hypothetical protein